MSAPSAAKRPRRWFIGALRTDLKKSAGGVCSFGGIFTMLKGGQAGPVCRNMTEHEIEGGTYYVSFLAPRRGIL